jgi:biopolymer transport protein ExbB
MGFSFSAMWQTMGIPAKIVGLLLVTMGLASLTVFIERLLTLRRSREASRLFAAELGEGLRAGEIEATIALAGKHLRGFLPRLVQSVLTTYWQARSTGEASRLSPLERTRRHTERVLEELGTDLRRGLAVLATVGSVAPFVGLLGTVLGIISAFQGIASTGSGGLSSVAAGISEALVETALGLAVAIPAVLAFNYLSTTIGHDEMGLTAASGELIDMIESWGDDDGLVEASRARHERVA